MTVQVDDRLARHNALVLAVCQALGGSNASIIISAGGLTGAYLLGAGNAFWATLPVSLYIVGTAAATVPVQLAVRRIGRRNAYLLGTLFGVCGGLTAMTGTLQGSFFLLCLGTFLSGVFAAMVQSYRFAAADTASPAFRPKAISWVLAGGVAAGVLGPQAFVHFKDFFAPVLFSFLAQALITGCSAIILFALKVPAPAPAATHEAPARPLSVIARQPAFLGAVFCAVASYALMSLVMTASPLAMVACGFTSDQAALGIQWHVIAMFGPSFFTGHMIQRFGAVRIVAIGLTLLAGCSAVALAGITLAHFWIALILLGIGWNFGFLGASFLVTRTYEPSERNLAQGFNDFVVFGFVGLASLSSGAVFNLYGWDIVNWIVFPVIVLATFALRTVHRELAGA